MTISSRPGGGAVRSRIPIWIAVTPLVLITCHQPPSGQTPTQLTVRALHPASTAPIDLTLVEKSVAEARAAEAVGVLDVAYVRLYAAYRLAPSQELYQRLRDLRTTLEEDAGRDTEQLLEEGRRKLEAGDRVGARVLWSQARWSLDRQGLRLTLKEPSDSAPAEARLSERGAEGEHVQITGLRAAGSALVIRIGDDLRVLSEAGYGEVSPLRDGAAGGLQDFSVDGQGRMVSSLRGDQVPRLWQVDTGKLLREFESGSPVAIAPSAEWVAVGDDRGGAKLWPANRGETRLLAMPQSPFDPLLWMGFSGDSQTLFTIGGNSSELRLWNVASGALKLAVKRAETRDPNAAQPAAVAISSNARVAAVAYRDGDIMAWDEGGNTIAKWQGPAHPCDMAVAPDGSRMAITAAGELTVFRLTSGEKLWQLKREERRELPIRCSWMNPALAWSQQADVLAGVNALQGVGLWDADTGVPIGEVRIVSGGYYARTPAGHYEASEGARRLFRSVVRGTEYGPELAFDRFRAANLVSQLWSGARAPAPIGGELARAPLPQR